MKHIKLIFKQNKALLFMVCVLLSGFMLPSLINQEITSEESHNFNMQISTDLKAQNSKIESTQPNVQLIPLPANGTGTGGTFPVSVPDLNKDGVDDFLVSIFNTTSYYLVAINSSGRILWKTPGVMSSQSGGSYNFGNQMAGTQAWWSVPYDDNGDGNNDVFGSYPNGTGAILSGKDGSILANINLFSTSGTGLRFAIPDVTGDGKSDIVFQTGRGTHTDDGYIGVINSSSRQILWKKGPYGYSGDQNVGITLFPDVNKDGKWEILVRAFYENKIFLLDSATGFEVWSHTVSFDAWDVMAIPDINGDGIFDVIVGDQGSNFEILSGADGTVINTLPYTKSGMFHTLNDSRGNVIVGLAQILSSRTLHIYNFSTTTPTLLSSKTFTGFNYEFLQNPNSSQKDFVLIRDDSTSSAYVYYIDNLDTPIYSFPNWNIVIPLYGNSTNGKAKIILTRNGEVGIVDVLTLESEQSSTPSSSQPQQSSNPVNSSENGNTHTVTFTSGFELQTVFLAVVISFPLVIRRKFKSH